MRPTRNPEARSAVLYPFQTTGARWLTGQRFAMLGDEMGVGKSVQAIRAADHLKLKSILVTAPTNAIYNWRNEFSKFSLWDRRVQVLDKGSTPVDPSANVIVVTHGLCSSPALRLQLGCRKWDLLVADEAQAFKRHESKRTTIFYGKTFSRDPGSVSSLAERVWLQSGTPTENGAHELWTHLHALRPDLIPSPHGRPMDYEEFRAHYCVVVKGGFGPRVIGNKTATLQQIRTQVLKPFVLRRLKASVLPELPAVRYDLVTLPATRVPQDMKKLEKLLGPEIRAYLDDVEAGVDGFEALKRLEAQEEDAGSGLARLERMIGRLKVDWTVELLQEQFAAFPNSKVLVFAKHLELIGDLVTACAPWRAESITGATSARERQAIADRFQSDPTRQVFVGQIKACATAMTLTAASEVLFPEASWVPTDNQQAVARADRIGQTEPIRVRFLALEGSIDEAKMTVLARKVRINKELLA